MAMITFPPLKPSIVLGVAAHPDDLDFGAAGTLAKFAAKGAAVNYLILTDGSRGTADPNISSEELITMRQDEQRAANSIIGGKNVFFRDYPDGRLEVTMALKRDIVEVIRMVRPDVVVTMDPSVLYAAERGFINHPDHRAAGQATLDAVYPLARDHLSFPDLFADGYQPHKVQTLLLVNFKESNYYVDITGTLEKKFAAIAAHTSQVRDGEIIRERFTAYAADAGKAIGVRYAEGFMRIDIQ